MKITIRGDKLEVTKSIKEYIENKLTKLEKYFKKSGDIKCNVIIKVRNNKQTIEVTIPLTKLIVRAEESHDDLYAAIDLVVDKLEKQIRKNKSRITDHYKNVPTFELNFDDVKETEEEEKIIKRKNVDTKPMNEEEALIQMELLGHDFFAFKNTDEECVSVIYKRKDSSYGIINIK